MTVSSGDLINPDRISITWNSVPNAEKYQIYRSSTSTGTKTRIDDGTGSSPAYYDNTATPGLIYYYWLKACIGTNCSAYSTSKSGYRPLLTPGNFNASDGTSASNVTLNWDTALGAGTYEIYRAATSTGTKTLLKTIIAPTITYVDTTTTVATPFYYWVRACKGTICSQYSAVQSGYKGLTAPTVSASDGAYSYKIMVSWNAISGASSYQVYRAPEVTGVKIYLGTFTTTTFSDVSAETGTTYYYFVTPCKGSYCGVMSAPDAGYLTP
jgi:fibronectin type 3 domain-containing protein